MSLNQRFFFLLGGESTWPARSSDVERFPVQPVEPMGWTCVQNCGACCMLGTEVRDLFLGRMRGEGGEPWCFFSD